MPAAEAIDGIKAETPNVVQALLKQRSDTHF